MTARASDCDDIVRVVQFSVESFNNCDISNFREAFNEDAWIFDSQNIIPIFSDCAVRNLSGTRGPQRRCLRSRRSSYHAP